VQYFTLNKVKMTQETRHLGQHVIYNLNCWVQCRAALLCALNM
jgi:hypothetical protein